MQSTTGPRHNVPAIEIMKAIMQVALSSNKPALILLKWQKQIWFPSHAQSKRLKALTEACTVTADNVANVYTDSVYTDGVCHLFGAV